MGVYRSMRSGPELGERERGAAWLARPRPHRRDEPTGLSLGTVALQQSRLLPSSDCFLPLVETVLREATAPLAASQWGLQLVAFAGNEDSDRKDTCRGDRRDDGGHEQLARAARGVRGAGHY
jgi:hypothetical protein